ncbi:MAG: plastocyanin/azurin family copper-binding protein [Candidatus Nitrosopolaris sp.]|jgi:plastocyanin
MLKKLNLNFSTISISVVLAIALTFLIVALPPNALGQSKTTLVSIVKGASNPSMTEPYNPSPINVPKGTTVTWTNNDNTAHTVTQGNPSGNSPPNGFDSGILAPGKTFTHTFATAGTIQYYCTLHPTMLGEVIVK